MSKIILQSVAISAALALGACQSPFNGADDAWSAQTAHPITVQTKVVTEQFRVGSSDTELRQDDRDRIANIASDYQGRGIGKFTITSPQGSPNAAVSVQVAAQMTEIAQEQGVSARNVDVTGYHASTAEASPPIIVSYSVYDATPSACGNWSTNYAFAPHNFMTPNHGCATQNNLAAMVEDPRDLTTPRSEQGTDQGRRTVMLEKYRKGELTGAKQDDQSSGAVSEVNK